MTGYKTYVTGKVLVADDLNNNLQQGVLLYANSAARDSNLLGLLREGMVAYLQDTNSLTVYNGSSWITLAQTSIPNAAISTVKSGSVTLSGVNYDYWVYNSTGTITVTTAGFADVMCVAGGGGSAGGAISGAGAGGVNIQNNFYLPAGTLPVVVGGGGQGATDNSYYPFPSYNGSSSHVAKKVLAVGGGGSGPGAVGNTGGSGAGGGSALNIGLGTIGQGNNGGAGVPPDAVGGGGGAGAVGGSAVAGVSSGNGGNGVIANMINAVTYYGGGGGGGGNADAGIAAGGGGLGGGGAGSTGNGNPGSANTGGGAGAGGVAGGFGNFGANGGSGIVIIRVRK